MTTVMMMMMLGADPGFWFGRGTSRGSEGRKSPSGVQGQRARRMLRHKAEKIDLRREKNKSIQTDIV